MPKLKTHKKTGITCALKNIVGITQRRNLLPHHNEGTPEEGGDQYPSNQGRFRSESRLLGAAKDFAQTFKIMLKLFPAIKKTGELLWGATRDTTRSGNWFGNDTAWRMVLDLNKIFLYCDKNLELSEKPRTDYLTIVDAVICGEGIGPLEATPKKTGFFIIGQNPLAVDCVCSQIMGFNPDKIPMISRAFKIKNMPLGKFKKEDIFIKIRSSSYKLPSIPNKFIKNFEPHPGWKNYIENGN
jgi:hypothetical protein